jgi:hypothetical protein
MQAAGSGSGSRQLLPMKRAPAALTLLLLRLLLLLSGSPASSGDDAHPVTAFGDRGTSLLNGGAEECNAALRSACGELPACSSRLHGLSVILSHFY